MKGNRRVSRCAVGLSLVETLAAIMILQVAVLGVIYTVTAGHEHTQEVSNTLTASRLADDLMEEIMARAYADPEGGLGLGADTGESSRALFDDVDDYHNFSETSGNLADSAGTDYPDDWQTFTRSVQVVAASEFVADINATITGKTVTVSITSAKGRVWEQIRFIRQP